MGSLTSSPKPKAQPQVVYYMPAPSAPTATSSTPATGTNTPSTPAETEEQVREAGLLLRDRGSYGTVLTGFRGLLAPSGQGAVRKTLLGE